MAPWCGDAGEGKSVRSSDATPGSRVGATEERSRDKKGEAFQRLSSKRNNPFEEGFQGLPVHMGILFAEEIGDISQSDKEDRCHKNDHDGIGCGSDHGNLQQKGFYSSNWLSVFSIPPINYF